MHPTKVVVLKLHSPRKPSSGPQDATDAGCRAKRPVVHGAYLGDWNCHRLHSVTMH